MGKNLNKVINRTEWRIKQILSSAFLPKIDDFLDDGYRNIQRLKFKDELGAMREYNRWLEKRMTKLFK